MMRINALFCIVNVTKEMYLSGIPRNVGMSGGLEDVDIGDGADDL